MPALLDVARRTAETADQKITEPLLGPREIFLRIHRTQNRVVRNLRVERADETEEAVLADGVEYLFFVHWCTSRPAGADLKVGPYARVSRLARARRAAFCSASFFARPVADPSTSPLITTSIVNVLRWSGPSEPDSRYSGSASPMACTRSWSVDLWSGAIVCALPASIASFSSRRRNAAAASSP